MSLAYNLAASLAATQTDEDLTTLIIDHYTRVITIPKGITALGVESDDDVLRLNFKMPRYLGTVDLYNFSIRVNYINANGEDDVYKVTDKTIVGDHINFSWLVGPTATAYKGTTKFNVCMVITDANSVIKQEYNTAIASLPVLEGMECSERVISEYTDILEQWERRLFGIGDTEEANLVAVSEQQQTNIVNKGTEVLATIPVDYTSAVKMADEGVRTKADAIICSAEGDFVTVSDSSDDHLRGLKLFGKTIQTKTTGAQKLPFPYYDSSVTRYGVKFTVNNDGSITMKGTNNATDNVSCYFMLHSGFNATGVYTYKCYGLPSNCVTNIYYRGDVSGDTAMLLDLYAGNDYGIVIRIPAGAGVNTTVYPMLNEGDSALPYEPYTGGVPGPNPSYPLDLNSIEDPTINIFGKNLLPIAATNESYSGVSIVVNDDKSLTVNGTATNVVYYAPFKFTFRAGVRYVLSGCPSGGSNETYFMYINNLGGYRDYGDGVTICLDSDFTSDVGICIRAGAVMNGFTFYPMIRIADTASEYVKPSIASISVNCTISGVPVTSGGNYTDSKGQQWVCDEIDFERGVYVQRLEMNTFTLYKSVYEFAPLGYRYQHHAGNNFTPVNACLCRTMSYNDNVGTDVATTDGVRVNKDAGYFIAQYTDTDGTVDSIDLDILYIRPTPIETPLTADEIAAFQALKTSYPYTTVVNDAGAGMGIRYNADTKTWITNLIDEKIAAAVAKS